MDLYCLECGYNLRGLSGDPRRCPECGHLNPMGELEIPAALITRQLNQMETGPTLCVAAALAAGVPISLFVLGVMSGESPGESPCMCSCCGLPAMLAVPLWAVGMDRFRRSCLDRPGWERLLWRYHACGLLMAAGAVLVALTPALMSEFTEVGWLMRRLVRDNHARAAVVLTTSGLSALLLFTAGRSAYRRLKKDRVAMQRDVAVTLARERLRRDLERGP